MLRSLTGSVMSEFVEALTDRVCQSDPIPLLQSRGENVARKLPTSIEARLCSLPDRSVQCRSRHNRQGVASHLE